MLAGGAVAFVHGPDAAPDRPPQQRQSVGQRQELVFCDLLGLEDYGGEGRVAQRAAIEQEADAAGTALRWQPEVRADQAAGGDVESAFLANLALACLPGRLSVGFHDAARDRPARLIGRLEY